MSVERREQVVSGHMHLDSQGRGQIHGARETIATWKVASIGAGVAATTIQERVFVPFRHRLRAVSFGCKTATAVTPGTDPAADLYRHLPKPATSEFSGALASPAVAGNIEDGAHMYAVVFYNAVGNGSQSEVITVTVADKTTNGKVLLNLPLGPTGTTGRKIYRTAAAGAALLLLATVADNTTLTYLDNIADGSLGAAIGVTNVAAATVLGATVKLSRAAATAADASNDDTPVSGSLASGMEMVYEPCLYTVRAVTGAATGAIVDLYAILEVESYPS